MQKVKWGYEFFSFNMKYRRVLKCYYHCYKRIVIKKKLILQKKTYSLNLSRGKLQNLAIYFSSNKTLKINVFKQLDLLSFILEMQRYLHCKLHKIHSYVLAVIDWFLHKEFTTTEKYPHFFLENTVSCLRVKHELQKLAPC